MHFLITSKQDSLIQLGLCILPKIVKLNLAKRNIPGLRFIGDSSRWMGETLVSKFGVSGVAVDGADVDGVSGIDVGGGSSGVGCGG